MIVMGLALFSLREEQASLITRGSQRHAIVVEKLLGVWHGVLFKVGFQFSQPDFHGRETAAGIAGNVFGKRTRQSRGFTDAWFHTVMVAGGVACHQE